MHRVPVALPLLGSVSVYKLAILWSHGCRKSRVALARRHIICLGTCHRHGGHACANSAQLPTPTELKSVAFPVCGTRSALCWLSLLACLVVPSAHSAFIWWSIQATVFHHMTLHRRLPWHCICLDLRRAGYMCWPRSRILPSAINLFRSSGARRGRAEQAAAVRLHRAVRWRCMLRYECLSVCRKLGRLAGYALVPAGLAFCISNMVPNTWLVMPSLPRFLRLFGEKNTGHQLSGKVPQ